MKLNFMETNDLACNTRFAVWGLHVDQLQGHDLATTLGVLVPMTNRWIALLPRMRDNEESLISLMYVQLCSYCMARRI